MSGELHHEGFLFCSVNRLLGRDHAGFEEFLERIIHEAHAELLSCLDDAREHECFRFANDVSDGRRVHENLNGENTTGAIRTRHELLGDDAAQGFAHHDPDLVALVGGKNVEHAVERPGCVARVQSSENEVTGLRCGDRERDRLQVAHFPDHDDVRIFTESAPERVGE